MIGELAMRFDEVIVLGSAKIAIDCARYIVQMIGGEKLLVIETKESSLSMLRRNCEGLGVRYMMLAEKRAIEEQLKEEIRGRFVLMISANNEYIFPPSIVSQNVEIINFHYALLPHYRGMNIPTWVIYNNEKETGVTWHFVTEKIDHGKIISQRRIPIGQTTTPIEISKRGMEQGFEAFREFIVELLEHPIEGKDVAYPEDEVVYRRSMLPEDGVLDLSQSMEKILHLLRSFDYGGIPYIPYLKLRYKNTDYLVRKYRVREAEIFEESRRYSMINDKLMITEANIDIILYLSVEEQKAGSEC